MYKCELCENEDVYDKFNIEGVQFKFCHKCYNAYLYKDNPKVKQYIIEKYEMLQDNEKKENIKKLILEKGNSVITEKNDSSTKFSWNIKGFFTIFSILLIITLVGCIFDKLNENNASIHSEKLYSENEQNTVIDDKSVVEELASQFTLEMGTGFGKKLEDEWKKDKDNEELSAMYYYYSSNSYEQFGQVEMAKETMKNISPNYSGIMSDKIISYGSKLFENSDEWGKESLTKEVKKKELTNSKRKEIKKWIEDRYEYYDKWENRYCGDKYTKTILNEASSKFEYTYEEIYNIWCDLPL